MRFGTSEGMVLAAAGADGKDCPVRVGQISSTRDADQIESGLVDS